MDRFLSFFFLFFFFFSLAYAETVDTHPQEFKSFKIGQVAQTQVDQQKQVGVGARGCSYTVKIKTSCSKSPRYTRDAISIAFGDAYGNQVYVGRLDDYKSGTFERCSTDTFDMQGPCGYGVCCLYLYRQGRDGWVPDSVKIYEVSYSRAITFYYGSNIPNNVWYGSNQCSTTNSNKKAIEIATDATEHGHDSISQI